MPRFILAEKLAALDDAASCASSGAPHRDSRDDRGLRSTDGSGICHTYPSDGRGISPPKTLMTNFYNSDSAFCINRVSANAQRAWLSAGEVIHLTVEFYQRNDIEELCPSSSVIQSQGRTMRDMMRAGIPLEKIVPSSPPMIGVPAH
jgi:predicted DNA-binding helix-hairpin-helix protein